MRARASETTRFTGSMMLVGKSFVYVRLCVSAYACLRVCFWGGLRVPISPWTGGT
jgi:hypothetical protein